MLLYPWQRSKLAQAARKQGLVGDIHLGDFDISGFQQFLAELTPKLRPAVKRACTI